MSDNYKKDKLENLFKNSFDELPETPAENGWDLPSEDIWSRVDAELRPHGRRRGGLLWWILGGGLLIIAALMVFWAVQQKYSDSTEMEHKLEIVENGENNNLENRTALEAYSKQEEYLDESSEINEGIDDANISIDKAEVLSAKPRVRSEETGVSERNEKPAGVEISEQRQRLVNDKNNFADRLLGQKVKDQINNEQSIDTAQNQDVEVVPVEIEQLRKEEVIGPVVDTVSLKRKIVQEDFLQQLPLKMQVLTYEMHEKLPNVTYEANDFITPTAPKMAGLYVGVEASVLQSYRTIMAKREFVIPRFYEDEEPDISLGYGVNVGYQFSKNWALESGLNYTSTGLAFRARRQIRYTMVDEQPAGGGEFQSDYKLPFETSNGTIDSDVAVARSASTQVAENDFIALSLQGEQNFSYLNVPILARYHFGKGRWQLGLKGGVVNRILLDASFQFSSITTARQGIRVVVNDRFFRKRSLDKVNNYQVDFEIGAGLRFFATEHLWVYAEPTYRRSINPSHESMNFKTFPTVKAIEFGVGWRF